VVGNASGTSTGAATPEEPFYGKAYLPRKFKVGITFPNDNCIDIHTHDLGLLAIIEGTNIIGFNALVGGGMGVTPAKNNTFPALAQPLAFIPCEQAIPLIESVVRVHRDYGNRSDRKTARLKYLIHAWGLDRFRAQVERYHGQPLAPPRDIHVHGTCNHLGWHAEGDGTWYYGLRVTNGRIRDTEQVLLKSAIREICRRLSPGIRLTAYQQLLFTNVREADRTLFESILRNHGVVLSEALLEVQRWSIACVAWPTCGLAITESERALPGILHELEQVLARLGLAKEAFTVRMTGCPNGCSRPYNADIGLVGRARKQYTIFLGGNILGTHLGEVYRDRVPLDEIVPTLVPVLDYFRQERTAGESFGDFCRRKGMENLRHRAEG